MDEIGCPRCKTTKRRKPDLVILVNNCGHALCDFCVELLFAKGSGPCPECGIPLRRSAFRVQLFEDPVVEKEIDIRRRLLKDYCKKEKDFKNLREYNDYLEEVETIVFNLVNNIDVFETNKAIEQYKKDNKEQIANSKTNPKTFFPTKPTEEVLRFVYVEPILNNNNGPPIPTLEKLMDLRTNHGAQAFGRLIHEPAIRDKVTGYHPAFEVRRIFMEAFSDICYDPSSDAGIKCYPFVDVDEEDEEFLDES